MTRKSLLTALSLCLLSGLTQAAGIKVENAWVRATAPGQQVAGAFMDITADADMALVTGASPAAKTVELHFMRMDGGMMEMRELDKIDLPKGEKVSLEPGGMHVMLIGLKARIKPGDKVPLTLTVKDAKGARENVSVTLTVPAAAE